MRNNKKSGVISGAKTVGVKNTRGIRWVGVVVLLVGGFAGHIAVAEGLSESSTPQDRQLGEVVVQARRNSESQQIVPVAVSVVSNDRLLEDAASNVADVQRLVPSLQIQQSVFGTTDFLIRGSFAGFSVDPSVVTYVDDVPIDSRTLVYNTFDLASAQVLKGPQGTLFGKNSTGGAVLFFSQKPTLSEEGGYVDLRYGNYNERRAEAAVNVPVGRTLAFRLAGEYEQRDGTLTSITSPGLQFNDRDNYSVRASSLWRPNDVFENYTQVTVARVMESRYPRVPVSLAGPCTGPTTPALTCLYSPPFNAFLGTDNLQSYVERQFVLPSDRVVQNKPDYNDVIRDAVTNTLTINFGEITLRDTAYFGYTNLLFSNDWDGTPARVFELINPSSDHTVYNETQLYGKLFSNRLDWRLGGVYSDAKGSDAGNTVVFPLPGSLSTPNSIYDQTNFRSYALFGQTTYDFSVLLKGLSFTTGYRYTWDHRTLATQNFVGTPTPICQLQTLPVPATGPEPYPDTDLSTCTRRLTLASSNSNYNFTLSWQATDELLLYAATRKGYKAGSFNTYPPQGPSAAALSQYAPEIVKDVELGLKSDWKLFSVPVRANLAAYDSRYTDIQVSQTYINPLTGAVAQVVENSNPSTGQSNKAKINGFEAELTVVPLSWFELTAFYSRIYDATFSQYATVTGLDLAGQHIDGVIPTTYGATAHLTVPVSGPFDALTLTTSYYYASAPLLNASSTLANSDSRSFDARIEARHLFGSGASLALYGKNLGNSMTCNFDAVVSGELTRACGDPRTYGVEVRYSVGSER